MPAPAWRRPLLLSAVAAGLLTPLAAAPAHAAPPTFRAFTPVSLPTGLATGPDGNIWATSAAADSVMRITPSGLSQQFTSGMTLGGDPLGITAGPDGNMWLVENDASRVLRLATDGTVLGTVPLPAGRGPSAIVAGPDGNLWFTESTGNRIGRVTTSGNAQEFSPTFPDTLNGPSDIAAGADGNLWFTEPAANRIRRITPAGDFTGSFTFFRDNAQPGAITAGGDGNLWFTEANFPAIGRINPASGAATDFPISSIAGPVTAGSDGNVWFTMANGSIGRITPAGVVTEFPVPAAVLPAGTTFIDIRTGPDANLWASTSNGKLLRITTGATPPRFTDSAQIKVPGTGDSGIADPYPATIEADGLQGTVTKVTVRLNGVHHGFASDIHAQLVGPQGQSAVLMANATDRLPPGPPEADVFDGDVLTFSDGAPAPGRRPTTGVFAPFDPGFLLAFVPPAPPNVPAPPANLAVFNGTNPNGAWKLFLVDDSDHPETIRTTTGVIAGGWSLDIQTTGPPPVQLPPVQLPAPDPIIVPGPTVTVAGQSTSPAADTTRPTLKLAKLQTRMKLRDFRKGVSMQVTPSEPVTLDTTLFVSPRLVFDRTSKLSRAQTVVVKPSAKLLGSQKRTFKVRLRFVATDGAANRTTLQRTITVTP